MILTIFCQFNGSAILSHWSTTKKRNTRNKPEGSAEFLIVHSGLVLALAPFLCHKLRLVEFELALLAHPGDAVSCILVRQQLQQELPQLDLTVVA